MDRDTDPTETQGFENAGQNMIIVGSGVCPQCLKRMGETGRNSALVNVLTASGASQWCFECYQKGLHEGTCQKLVKRSKK